MNLGNCFSFSTKKTQQLAYVSYRLTTEWVIVDRESKVLQPHQSQKITLFKSSGFIGKILNEKPNVALSLTKTRGDRIGSDES